MKHYLTLFILLISLQYTFAQASEYNMLIKIADSHYEAGNSWRPALNYYKKAAEKAVDSTNRDYANDRKRECQKIIDSQTLTVEKQNLDLIAQQDSLKKQSKNLIKEKEAKDEALGIAESIVSAFYFYGDSLALAFNNNKYGFIDKDGRKVITYEYDDASPFAYPGKAKVKKGKDYYLIDGAQKEYLLGEGSSVSSDDIKAIDLSNKELTDIPPWVFESKNLNILLLINNEITSIPSELDSLKLLKELVLFKNQLYVLPESIDTLQELELLNVGNNHLRNLPDSLIELRKLKMLVLSNNQLAKLPLLNGLDSLKLLDLGSNLLDTLLVGADSLSNLNVLYLDNNQFNYFPPDVNKLINLQVLDLWGNEIESLPKNIVLLSKLQELILGDNQFKQFPKAIENMHSLTFLDISHNQLRSVQTVDFKKLKKLKTLDLSYCGLDSTTFDSTTLLSLSKLSLAGNDLGKIPDSLHTFSELIFLDLSYTNLDTIYTSIASLNKLEELYLNDNKLTNLPLEIKNLKELKLLDLSNNSIQIEARDSIAGWLPKKCEIIYEKVGETNKH